MYDLHPATQALGTVVAGVRDDQLVDPTPCPGFSVADLLDHVDGLAHAFAEAAAKEVSDGSQDPPAPDGATLAADWRRRIPRRLATLARAWREEPAWSGMTQAGGVDLPGEVAALVAVNEVIVHAWDLATATGQRFGAEPDLVAAALRFVEQSVRESPGGTPGLFGPPVPTPADADPLHRLIGLTGRDVEWRPTT